MQKRDRPTVGVSCGNPTPAILIANGQTLKCLLRTQRANIKQVFIGDRVGPGHGDNNIITIAETLPMPCPYCKWRPRSHSDWIFPIAESVGARHLKHLNINYNISIAVPRLGRSDRIMSRYMFLSRSHVAGARMPYTVGVLLNLAYFGYH